MIDLHCHILSDIDDGASDDDVSLAMARAFVDDGVVVVACTPHILPGLYHNSGPHILDAVARLQSLLVDHEIPLQLVSGADVHLVPDMVAGLRSGHLLSLAGTRYVLVEPPHHVKPPRLADSFFELVSNGYVPILTHPERLTWVPDNYDVLTRLVESGTWMQLTAGSLTGDFGQTAQYISHRMLDEGLVHILATDSHDTRRRPPVLSRARDHAAKRVGEVEAGNLVSVRPRGILDNALPSHLPSPGRQPSNVAQLRRERVADRGAGRDGFARRLLRFMG